jgi:hypothetical protein
MIEKQLAAKLTLLSEIRSGEKRAADGGIRG